MLGALLGAIGAIAGAIGGYHARVGLVRALGAPDFAIAIPEDLIAIGLGLSFPDFEQGGFPAESEALVFKWWMQSI